jgi:hypothetical protein
MRPTFWKKWATNFLRALDSGVSRLAVAATLVGFAGFTISNLPYAWAFLAACGVIVFAIALWTKPAWIPAPNLAGPLQLSAINEFLSDTLRVGIVGAQGAGKTTFLDATVARPTLRRQTEKPYGQFVTIPDSDPERYLVLLDTVGARDHVQYAIQACRPGCCSSSITLRRTILQS